MQAAVDGSSQMGLALGLGLLGSPDSCGQANPHQLGQKVSLTCFMTPLRYKPYNATRGLQMLPCL